MKVLYSCNLKFLLVLVILGFISPKLVAQVKVAPSSCYPQYTSAAQMDAAAALDHTNQAFGTWKGAYDYAIANGINTIDFAAGTYVPGTDGLVSDWGNGSTGMAIIAGMTVNGNGAVIDNSTNGSSQICFATIAGNGASVSGFTFIGYTGVTCGAMGVNPDITNWSINNCNFDGCDKKGDALKVNMGATGSGTIDGCNFYNNLFTTGSAMAVTGSSTTAVLDIKNSVYSCNLRIVRGGAVQIENPVKVNFTSCSFEGNQTNSAIGGALSIQLDAEVSLTDTDFICNSADVNTQDDGGAIAIEDGANVTIVGGNYFGNFCKRYGGAIYLNGTITSPVTVSITGTSFEGNYNTTSSADGGAIYSRSYYNLSIDECLFLNNTSIDKGSAYGTYTNPQAPRSTTITNSTFTGNTAGSGEGAINSSSSGINIDIDDSVIAGNSPKDVENESGNVTLDGSICVTCSGTSGAGNSSSMPSFDANYQVAGGQGWSGMFTAGVCTSCLVSTTAASDCSDQGSIAGTIFSDEDDHAGDDDGVPIAGATVQLYDCAGNLVASVSTDASGNYFFGGLAYGNCYYVQYSIPAGFVSATIADAAAADIDSDADPNTLQSPQINICPSCNATDQNTADGVTGAAHYSNWDAGFTVTALPVELVSFEQHTIGCQTSLIWQTASEKNNMHFEIERSVNGRNFESLAFIDGAGNSNTFQYYSYIDKATKSARLIYYRLKQVDFDQSFAYSKVISVAYENCNEVLAIDHIYPNPFNQDLNFEIYNKDHKIKEGIIEIHNVIGSKVLVHRFQIEKGQNTITLQTAALAPGTYFARLVSNGHPFSSTKLIKTN